jgi:hypothetical protein
MQITPIANWIPYQMNYTSESGWMLKWLELRKKIIDEPFFDETIQICRSKQRERSALQSLSNPDFMIGACKGLHFLTPSAFIFHVSRCGSTLLSQAFSQSDENIVIAEAPLLDEILRAGEKQPEIQLPVLETWFKSALHFMGQHRNFKESNYLIKLDSWHIHFYQTLRQWFPTTPFFFLYRKPEEVIASHDKRRGIHSVPGMINNTLLKTERPDHYGSDFNRYTAEVLQRYYQKLAGIHQLKCSENLFFDYATGVKEMVCTFSSFTGIPVHQELFGRLNYHSKSSNELFRSETKPEPGRFYFRDCHHSYEHLRSINS